MKKLMFMALILMIIASCACATTEAAVPRLINYQGRLTDANGNPLTGSFGVTFRIFDAETAGTLLWEETQTGVLVEKGLFSILLGSVTALAIPFDKPYFLEIKVGTEVMSPRQMITSAGYALRAEVADNLAVPGKVGTKMVDETGISDGMVAYYDSVSQKVKYKNVSDHWVQVEARNASNKIENFIGLSTGTLYRVYIRTRTSSTSKFYLSFNSDSASRYGYVKGAGGFDGSKHGSIPLSDNINLGVNGWYFGEFMFGTYADKSTSVHGYGEATFNTTNPTGGYWKKYSYSFLYSGVADVTSFQLVFPSAPIAGKIILEKYVP